jgi:hypothetical protein
MKETLPVPEVLWYEGTGVMNSAKNDIVISSGESCGGEKSGTGANSIPQPCTISCTSADKKVRLPYGGRNRACPSSNRL